MAEPESGLGMYQFWMMNCDTTWGWINFCLASSRFGLSPARARVRPGEVLRPEPPQNHSWSGARNLIEATKSTEAKTK